MRTDVISGRPTADEVASIIGLVERVERLRGYRPLSDQAWLDLTQHAPEQLLSAMVTDIETDGALLAYAQASHAHGSWSIELVVSPSAEHLFTVAAPSALRELITAVRHAGGGPFDWLVQDPTPTHEALAAALGLALARRLHQMRRELPTGIPFEITTRAFDPSRDIDDWVRVNARAFVWNPEQGSWTADEVTSRMDEPWFDASGFLVHEIDGRMAGFCWTKVHATAEPPMGEIYVIAVDPDFHGRGLGRALTLAGLAWLAEHGMRVGMLFVDGDNVAAIRLYEQLGFVIHRTDCLYHADLEGDSP